MARDPERLHGSHVVSRQELEAAFAEDPDDDGDGRRFRLRLRHAVVLVVLLVLVAGGIGVAFAIQKGYLSIPQAESTPQKTSVCPSGTFTPLKPSAVKVNVFNATDRRGLAGNVAAQLKARKFVVGAVTNRDLSLNTPVAVISGKDGYAAALTVQRQFQGADYYQDARSDGTVDVILFQGFAAVTPTAKVAQGPGQLLCPRELAASTPAK
ncbi:LytR C-terminal domain-containing protein [Arthrobacter woluwensis]|uniref:LytR C-terminal domain-containing protein n=1 Tax=Arthrobacter woluwensis TaxID=156980 RepID=UPI001AAF0EF3|nr:LytR C-terminal domain-containing protein [Arthrobacter woluwensis]QTF73346.1 LytR C-terminal domain-containing protein [Arthrobacter woluwensis]